MFVVLVVFFFFFLFLFLFLVGGTHPRPVEAPRLGAELELQLLAYTTAHSNARSQSAKAGDGPLHPHGY